MSRLAELLVSAKVTTRSSTNGFVAQLVPTERRYTDPLVLRECSHHHRTERAASTCGQQLLATAQREVSS